METQSTNKLSSPHVDAPSDPQYAQSPTGDTQTVKWSQPDTDPYDPPWSRNEYHWPQKAPPCEC